MLYLHGGSFVEGAGSDKEYEATNLVLTGDIVVVTVNYRLGVLGFMDFSFLDENFVPNCGLRDIILALRWVNENIVAFGGDTGNVTVCGQSAGATIASVLPAIEETNGYLKRIIMMSGVPMLLHTKEQAQYIAKSFLEFMQIPDKDSLLATPAEKLAEKQNEFAQHSGLGAGTYAICVDGDVLPEYPICVASEGKMSDISMFIGTTREEMSFALYRSLTHIVDIKNIRKTGADAEKEDVKERITSAYKRYGKRWEGIMYSDFAFRMPSVWLAEAQSKYADTWMYRFDYETFSMRISGLHAFHSCDIPFLFGNFKAGLARLMCLLSPIKKGIRKLHGEFSGDFLAFIKTGELPWEKCNGENTPAKCYNLPSFYEQVVPLEVKQTYNGSEFKRKSLAGESMLPVPNGKD
jgi:para-nitrobenzyl esterase